MRGIERYMAFGCWSRSLSWHCDERVVRKNVIKLLMVCGVSG